MAKQKYKFERLTPIDNMDLDVYEEAIDYVFSNSDVKNVAISGAYSAGKSSVLASYKKKHGELRFLHISLAHFKSTDQENKSEVKESTLEGKILNQLIHQIPSEKIPQTNFRVKKTVSARSLSAATIGAVLFFISIIHLLFFSVWKNYVSFLPVSLIKSILMPSTHPYALIVDGIIILVLLSLSVYKLIRIQREKNIFRKLNIKGNEIEIFEKSDDSYFDKYLNEVLYLFENADADVIVFEDMDRFNTNGIFERLREVNTLANIQLNKEGKKVLRFFYLLRDDIFDSKDRTKFFDYIIPVVPVVDGSNSYDQFISQLKSAGTFEKFDKSFLQGLSLYIDDMRLLKNIYNEFVIYYNRLNITELDCNKMLAIIAYKNLFPRDFADLQLNQGFVCTLFSKKDKFVENEVSEIKREIEEIRSKISSYKAEHLISMRELDAVFADKYLSGYDLRRQNDNDLSEFITKHLSGSSKDEYLHRRQMLEEKLDGNSDKLSQEILRLEQNIVEFNDKHLHQIITRENIDSVFSISNTNEIGITTNFNDIKGSEYFDLLKYIIRNGYINLQKVLSKDTKLKELLASYGITFDIPKRTVTAKDKVININYDNYRDKFRLSQYEQSISAVAHRLYYDYLVNGFMSNDDVFNYGTEIHKRPEFFLQLIKLFPQLKEAEQKWIEQSKSYKITFFAYIEQIQPFCFELYNLRDPPFDDWSDLSIEQRLKKQLLSYSIDRAFKSGRDETFLYIKDDVDIPPEQIISYEEIHE